MVDAEPPAKPDSPVALYRLSLTTNDAPPPRNDPNIPDTESGGPKEPQREVQQESQPQQEEKTVESKTKDSTSDYGDDVFDDDDFDGLDDNLFDDDMLAEIDASLASPKPEEGEPEAEPEAEPDTADTNMADTTADEFGDLDDGLDDDVFTAVAAIESNTSANPIEITSSIPQPVEAFDTKTYTKPAPTASACASKQAVADMEDMFDGDDFGEDFDFDAAELAATQAANRAGPSSAAATPWANTQNV